MIHPLCKFLHQLSKTFTHNFKVISLIAQIQLAYLYDNMNFLACELLSARPDPGPSFLVAPQQSHVFQASHVSFRLRG